MVLAQRACNGPCSQSSIAVAERMEEARTAAERTALLYHQAGCGYPPPLPSQSTRASCSSFHLTWFIVAGRPEDPLRCGALPSGCLIVPERVPSKPPAHKQRTPPIFPPLHPLFDSALPPLPGPHAISTPPRAPLHMLTGLAGHLCERRAPQRSDDRPAMRFWSGMGQAR